MKNLYIKIITLLVLTATISSCTDPEESLEWRAGENLRITGSDEISTLSASSYYVQGFTIDETYNWTLTGPSGELTVRRDGEFVDVFVDEPGTYILTVSNGTYDGSLTIEAASEVQELGFELDSISVMEGMGPDTIMIPITIADRNPEGATVSFSFSGESTATEGVDFRILTESPITFGEAEDEAGVSFMETTKYIEIVILPDSEREDPAEIIILTLDAITETGEGEAAVGLSETTEVTIYIEDDLKFVSFENTENDSLSDVGNYVYNVVLSSAADSQVIVPYSVAGAGVTPLIGQLTFAEGTTVQPLPIAVSELAFTSGQSISISLGAPISDDEEVEVERDEENNPVGIVKTILIDND